MSPRYTATEKWSGGIIVLTIVIALVLWVSNHNHHKSVKATQVTRSNSTTRAYNPDEIARTEGELILQDEHKKEEQRKSTYQIPRFLAMAKVAFQAVDGTVDSGYLVLALPNVDKFDGNNKIFVLLEQWKISPQEKAEDDPFLVLEEHSLGDYRALESNNKEIIYRVFVDRHLSRICAIAVCCPEGKTKKLFSIQGGRLIPVSD